MLWTENKYKTKFKEEFKMTEIKTNEVMENVGEVVMDVVEKVDEDIIENVVEQAAGGLSFGKVAGGVGVAILGAAAIYGTVKYFMNKKAKVEDVVYEEEAEDNEETENYEDDAEE